VRRRPQLTLALVGAVLLLAAPAASAAGPLPDGVVTGTFATSPAAALAHWTPQRRRAAEPLAIPTLPGSSEDGAAADSEPLAPPAYVPAVSPGEEAPRPRLGPLATTSSVEGVPVGAAESTVFPNSANGVLIGEYVNGSSHESYRCSGSVVSSSAGNVVLTAGHCVKDPDTGTVASFLVFMPGYREGAQPFGQWVATEYAITEEWAQTAGTSRPNEAGDVAMLKVASSSTAASVQATVGSLGVAFNQPRAQTYTQYGYPAEKPYNGKLLYSHTAAYAGDDDEPSFSPAPMKIPTDFTGGSSGGPWTVLSGSTPVALSVTDYGYKGEPGFLYGPYFGSLAQHVYELITGTFEPVPPPSPAPASSPAPPAPAPVSLRLLGISHDRGSGTATVRVAVSGAGTLRLSGGRVWTATRKATGPATLSVRVRARGGAAGDLREEGSVAVGVRLSFTATAGGTATRSRLLRLTARPESP
jgi:V8-like Glu-specific endopeptidase